MFLPTTQEELKRLKIEKLDIIIVTGDTYIDSPFIGAAVIGRALEAAGFTVGIIAQPDVNSDADITRLGEPRLFWGVTAGAFDSMVANYTASLKKRKSDDLTPGGENNRRPDRACLVYTNLIRRFYKKTAPVVLGGIEASLRRVAHYDYWTDKIRRSILFDAKADIVSYGMGEKTLVELATCLRDGTDWKNIRGICYAEKERINIPGSVTELPTFEEVANDKKKFSEMFYVFYKNSTGPVTDKKLIQKHTDRYLVCMPPQLPPTPEELDKTHELPFTREVHPYYAKQGKVIAQDTIQYSVTTHRGCIGECSFCAIALHQGRALISRSEESIVREVNAIAEKPSFKGIITDVGGPTANMYQATCPNQKQNKICSGKRCLHPQKCDLLELGHDKQIGLLNRLKKNKKIRKIFVASGIRLDLVYSDREHRENYLETIVSDHLSGQMKIAPEHVDASVLKLMQKTYIPLERFKEDFYALNQKCNKKQFLTYYLMAAHPGCGEKEMINLKNFFKDKLRTKPEQVQIFTPTPSTFATLMYHTEMNPWTGESIFVEKSLKGKTRQKEIIMEEAQSKSKRKE